MDGRTGNGQALPLCLCVGDNLPRQAVLDLIDCRTPIGAFYSQLSDHSISAEGLVGTIVYREPVLVAAKKIGLIKAPKALCRAALRQSRTKSLAAADHSFDGQCRGNQRGVARVSQDGKTYSCPAAGAEKQGLLLTKDDPETVGVLPDADNGTVLHLANNRRAVIVKNPDQIPGKAARQDHIFGEQREDFADALQSGRQERFAKVFARCARIAGLKPEDPRRTLVPYWTEGRQDTVRRRCAGRKSFCPSAPDGMIRSPT